MKTWSDILFVSDCHLSDRGPGDDFKPREDRFLDLLDWAEAEKIYRIVTVGDFLDCWEAPAEKIREKYDYLIGRMLKSFRWEFVCGNHDEIHKVAFAFLDVLEKSRRPSIYFHRDKLIFKPIRGSDAPVNKILPLAALHGHVFDPMISKWPKLAGAVAAAGGFFERHGLPNIDKQFSRFESWLSGIGRHDKNGGLDAKVYGWASVFKYRAAISGHSHRESVGRFDGEHEIRFLFNCGSWTNPDRPLRAVAVREDAFQVLNVNLNMKIEIIDTIQF